MSRARSSGAIAPPLKSYNGLAPYPDLQNAFNASQRLMLSLPWGATEKHGEAATLDSLVSYYIFDYVDFGACNRALQYVSSECAAVRGPRPGHMGRLWGDSSPEVLALTSEDISCLMPQWVGFQRVCHPLVVGLDLTPYVPPEEDMKPGELLPCFVRLAPPPKNIRQLWDAIRADGLALFTAERDRLENLWRILAEALDPDQAHLIGREIRAELEAVADMRRSAKPPPPPAKSKISRDVEALAIFFQDRTRTKKAIAKLLGIPTQSISPGRCPKLHAAMCVWRQQNAIAIPHGSKGKDGSLEAWDDAE